MRARLKGTTVRTPDRRASSAKRGYGRKWRRARAAYLSVHPLCVRCMEDKRIMPASVVDHVVPHQRDMALFWDSDNWQGLCKACHDHKTASEDGGLGNARK